MTGCGRVLIVVSVGRVVTHPDDRRLVVDLEDFCDVC
jgi:hypothetical protein